MLDYSGTVGSSVYVSNTTDISDGLMCFNDSDYTIDTVPAIANISCSTKAQYVIYYNEKRPQVMYPRFNYTFAANFLCEVEAYGKIYFMFIKCFLGKHLMSVFVVLNIIKDL